MQWEKECHKRLQHSSTGLGLHNSQTFYSSDTLGANIIVK